ncbi:MAG: hypothetical protein ACI9KN_000457 [Gammaproteobacteria bacterium]|jgi:hypothetical protein
MTTVAIKKPSKIQIGIAILWPSFLIAVVATGLFFSVFDPEFLFPFNTEVDMSTLGIYSVGFFLFWLLTALSGFGTLYFSLTNEVLTRNHSISAQQPSDSDQA